MQPALKGKFLSSLFFLATCSWVQANTPVMVNNSSFDLSLPSTYTPAGIPNPSNDVYFAGGYPPPPYMTMGGSYKWGTLDDFSPTPITIMDPSSTATISLNGGLNSISPISTADLIYVRPGASLTIGLPGTFPNLFINASGLIDTDPSGSLSGTLVINAPILMNGTLKFVGAAGSETINGSIDNNGGTLVFGGSGTVLNGGSMDSNSGSVYFNGTTQTISTLTLTGGTTLLEMAGLGSTLKMNSASLAAGTLDIDNWMGSSTTGGTGTIIYVGGIGALSIADLADVIWLNVNVDGYFFSTYTGAQIIVDLGGYYELTPVSPVPEPTTIFVSLCLLGLLGWNGRDRFLKKSPLDPEIV